MEIKNILISLSSVLIISAALPVAAHQDDQSGAHPNERQSEGQISEVLPLHTDKRSSTDTHYMMHSGGDHQGHLMEGAEHGPNQATEHEKQLVTTPPSNSTYIMHSGGDHQGHLMEDKNHTNQ